MFCSSDSKEILFSNINMKMNAFNISLSLPLGIRQYIKKDIDVVTLYHIHSSHTISSSIPEAMPSVE